MIRRLQEYGPLAGLPCGDPRAAWGGCFECPAGSGFGHGGPVAAGLCGLRPKAPAHGNVGAARSSAVPYCFAVAAVSSLYEAESVPLLRAIDSRVG